MALDNFRKVNITLNKANQHILEPQITKVGDVNGRELVVQLIDGGVIKDQTGAVLKLNWQHANGNQGSETFSPLDAKQGVFSVYYPENMLFRGTVTANISINENGKITNSLNFQIAVKGDVFDGSAVEVDGLLFTLKDLKDQLDERDSNLVDLENRQTSVESQFNSLQQEFTDKDVISAPEIIAARSGESTLSARLDKEKNEIDAQLAQTEKKVNFLSPLKLKDENEADFENYVNTSFFSGVTVYTQEGAREIHVCRVGERHGSFNNCLFAYMRLNDGRFYKKRLDLDYSIGDYRDPNLTYFPENKTLYLSIAVKKHDETYTNYMILLSEFADVLSVNEIKGMENHFTWGNSIPASDLKTLRTAYSVSTTGGSGVSLFRSGDAPNPFNYTKVLDLFPSSNQNPNECTLSLWGDKLIAITRQNDGNMLYRQTYDLTGLTGWGEIIDLGFVGHAPVVMPRISEGDPLILGYSYGTGEGAYVRRSPHFRLTYDGTNYSEPIVVAHLEAVGGYQSLVPNHNGFGTMYYEDSPTVISSTNVYYQELDIVRLLDQSRVFLKRNRNVLKDYQYHHKNNQFLLGDATKISGAYSSIANNTEIIFEVKREMNVTAIQMYLEQSETASSAIKLFEDGQLLTESGAVAITIKNTYEFAISATLKIGKRYKLQLTSNVKNFRWHYAHHSYSQIDFGDLIYLETVANGNSDKKSVVPFTLVRTI